MRWSAVYAYKLRLDGWCKLDLMHQMAFSYPIHNKQRSNCRQKNYNCLPSRKAGVAGSVKSWDENVGKATSEIIITQKRISCMPNARTTVHYYLKISQTVYTFWQLYNWHTFCSYKFSFLSDRASSVTGTFHQQLTRMNVNSSITISKCDWH